MVENNTTIKVSKENWQKLNSRKIGPGETFNDVVGRLLDGAE